MKPIPSSLFLALSMTVALAACKPAADAPADAATAAPAAEPAAETAAPTDPALAGTDVAAVLHHVPQDPATFDRKAFAGSFTGTLPCADCPGIDTRVDVDANGSFRLTESYQGSDVRRESSGTWVIDADGNRLQFDPDTKDDADRWFEIVSNNEIRILDTQGQPIESAFNHSLRRL